MALPLRMSPLRIERPGYSVRSSHMLPSASLPNVCIFYKNSMHTKKHRSSSLCVSCSASNKLVRDRSLDRHVVKQNKIRFVQKLITLLLSKPKHFMPLDILSKCRSYLALPKYRTILSMIHRYPTIFELFTMPYPPTPMNATKLHPQLCIRLTPAVEALAAHEANLKRRASITLATKLQKLLMLTSHRRLLLSKLVHLGPDLGLPISFRSGLCNEFPEKFRIVDTSYGHALELVSWDPQLATPLPKIEFQGHDLIVDRPLKFKLLKLRKGLNLKRRHHDYLLKLEELPNVCPYYTEAGDFPKVSMLEEKRACGVIREVLGMTIEKKTLVDHLTHFRKEFELPNKLRGLLLRHPELFYVSPKGQRDSVFLVEAYDDDGKLLEKDESSMIKDRLFDLVNVGKKIRRERKRSRNGHQNLFEPSANDASHYEYDDGEPYETDNESEDDGLEDLINWDDPALETHEGESLDPLLIRRMKNFWTTVSSSDTNSEHNGHSEPW